MGFWQILLNFHFLENCRHIGLAVVKVIVCITCWEKPRYIHLCIFNTYWHRQERAIFIFGASKRREFIHSVLADYYQNNSKNDRQRCKNLYFLSYQGIALVVKVYNTSSEVYLFGDCFCFLARPPVPTMRRSRFLWSRVKSPAFLSGARNLSSFSNDIARAMP